MIRLHKLLIHYYAECTYLNKLMNFTVDTGCTQTAISGLTLCKLYDTDTTRLINLFDNLDKEKLKTISTVKGKARSFSIRTDIFQVSDILIPNFKLSITDNFEDDIMLLGMDVLNALEGTELFKGQDFLYYNFNNEKYYEATASIQTYAKLENICSMLALNQHPYIEATQLSFEQLPSELTRLRALFGDLTDTELLDRAYTEFYT